MKAQARLLLNQTDPTDADAFFRAAVIAVKRGLGEEVLPLARRAVAAHPDDARMWQTLGLAARQIEETATARDAFTRAARLAPRDPLIAHSVARTTLEAGLPATDLFEAAFRLAPSDASVMLGRTAAQLAEGRIEEAIAQLDAILDEHPLWLDGQRTVVRLRWLAGERDSFTSSLEKALAAAPRNIDLWRDLIDSFMRAELYDKVLATIAQARAGAGPSPVFDAAEAVCAAERGDTREADRLFATLGGIHHITLLVRYVRHLLRSGRPAEAAAAAEARLGDDPEHHLLPYLAAAWRLLGDPRWEWLEGDPRLIGVYDIADRVGSLDALADRLRALHLTIHQPLDQTLRGGTQTDGALFARIEPEIRALRQAIVDTVATHVAHLPPRDPAHPLLKEARGPVRFAGSWSVRLSDAGYHINHVHPAGWISSAFYVALPERRPDEDRHAGWLSLGEVTELGLDLPPIRLIEPRPGRLVLFPSTMWHGTRPFAAGERLTVAFDVARPDE